MILASVASAFAPNKWIFLVARCVVGACVGINLNCVACYATEFSESKDRIIGMSIFNIVSALTPAVVCFLAWLIFKNGGWRWLIMASETLNTKLIKRNIQCNTILLQCSVYNISRKFVVMPVSIIKRLKMIKL